MKIFTLVFKGTLTILCFLLTLGAYSQVTIDNEDFETGWGIWNDGGGDCRRGTPYLPNNNYAIELRDNSGVASSMTTNNIDLTAYTSVDFTFDFEAVSMETGEDFWVQYSDNGGSSWTTIADYNSGTEFVNDTKYTPTLTLNSGTYTFSINSQFRIRCDASGNGDDVYIDNVIITGYTTIGPEIDIQGNGTTIVDGDTTPTAVDDTDFGSVLVGNNTINTFTIQNTGTATLNLTGSSPYVAISGTNAADFAVSAIPSNTIAASGSTTFNITFTPSATGLRTATLTIANDDSDENPYNFDIQGTGTTPSYCTSNGNNSDGYVTGTRQVIFNTINNSTPIEDNDYSDFTGISTTVTQTNSYNLTVNVNTDGNYTVHTFAWIDWNQDYDFNDAGEAYDLGTATNVTNGATSASPYSITIPGTSVLGNTRMRISTKYNSDPTNCETGFDGEVEDYTINIISSTPQPEINIIGNGTSIADGDTTPSAIDFTDFGSIDTGTTRDRTFSIQNLGTQTLNLTGVPIVAISGNAAFTVLTQPGAASIASGGGDLIFVVRYAPTLVGNHTATISIANDDSDENPYTFDILGEGLTPLTEGPGGITADLQLWLKATNGLAYTDGQSVSTWSDQGRGSDATVNTVGQEPTFRDNAFKNINFNPVVEFDNAYASVPVDGDFSYDDTTTEFLEGTSGYYSHEIFMVLIPDDTTINSTFGSMDIFCGDKDMATNENDGTGLGFGAYSQRFSGEVFCYAHGTSSGVGAGYGVADTANSQSYNDPGIINTRNNSGGTQQELYFNANNAENLQSDIPSFANVSNSRYWIGRSEGWEASLNARVAEVITYSARKNDTDLTQERNRIQSYLAIKYGITLGVNGTSQDYVDSAGSVIWDQSANAGYNYSVTGIGRDDASGLNQRQSKGSNAFSIVTIGHKDIAATNSANTNNFDTDRDYLVWGHNNATLSGSNTISVDLGASSTTVSTIFDRRWKIVEHRPTGSNDIRDVKISVPTGVFPALSDPANEEYALIVSTTSAFGNSDIVDVIPLNTNGSNLETWYDFDNTRFFTFGIASKVTGKFNVEFASGDFLVGEDSVDLNSSFTVSSWVRNLGSGGTIVSKGNAYDFRIDATGKVQVVLNGTTRLTSATSVNDSKWHHISATYSGTNLRLYIDGVEDGNSPVSAVPIPTSTTDRFAIGINYTDKSTMSGTFNGDIDEVRIWDSALTLAQIQFAINQEISEHTDNNVKGVVIPQSISKNDVGTIPWNNLRAYHDMNGFYGTTVEDGSNNDNWVRIKYLVPGKDIIDNQTTPLPFGSNGSGSWDTSSTWKNGSELYIPGSASLVDANVTVDWNIASISHDVTMDNSSLPAGNNDNRTLLGLIADSTNELTISSDNAVTVTHYLELNGSIDLEGESQLIQTDRSVLNVGANGSLERDQQGTSDLYTYNYWSSPVGAVNSTATNDTYTHRFTIPDVLSDGTSPASPGAITFITSSVNGSPSPFSIADYWIWKFANGLDDDYSSWQHMRSTGTIYAGEGYTMKGPGTGTILTPQNYVFEGKPNNGDIALTISAGNDYLVGNPYASAIDAHEFITDNPATSGTLYFWEHWGGGSHVLYEYQGGYALYNYSGGIPTASYGTNDPDVATGGTPTKLPGRYIPVSQGFFVYSPGGGTITFENDQRVFEKESATSVFVRADNNEAGEPINYNEDTRMKFRIGFNSTNTIHRQLLLTVDENASVGYDWGYDGRLNSVQIDDMFWMIENEKYGIQGTNVVNTESVFPLGIHARDNGVNSIQIDHLENVPDNVEIYVRDNELNHYHDLRVSEYEFDLTAGNHLERFDIVFSNRQATLDVNDPELSESFNIFYKNDNSSLVIRNSTLSEINKLQLFNIIGQSIYSSDDIEIQDYLEVKINNLSSGTYIVNLETNSGKISKKVLVE